MATFGADGPAILNATQGVLNDMLNLAMTVAASVAPVWHDGPPPDGDGGGGGNLTA